MNRHFVELITAYRSRRLTDKMVEYHRGAVNMDVLADRLGAFDLNLRVKCALFSF